MKLLQRHPEGVIFRLTKRDKEIFCDLLSRFPMVAPSSLTLSRLADAEELGVDEQFLQESLAASKAEARKALETLIADDQHFVPAGRSFDLKLSHAELSRLLQVFGDVRVGCWRALGCPDEGKGKPLRLSLENLEMHLAMEMTGRIQMLLLDSLTGRNFHGDVHLVDRKMFLPVELGEEDKFPSLNSELYEFGPSGMIAVGGDLSTKRLIQAYRAGIFPWSVDPITWWSPLKRGIIPLDAFRINDSLQRVLDKKTFTVTCDQAFREVITLCAQTRAEKTWISTEFIESYTKLHKEGKAHSIECWQEGKLVGGIYGVAIGGLFAAESMFYLESNASKVALVHLVQTLRQSGFHLLDVQMVTPVTAKFGAVEIDREEYLSRLKEALKVAPAFTFQAQQG